MGGTLSYIGGFGGSKRVIFGSFWGGVKKGVKSHGFGGSFWGVKKGSFLIDFKGYYYDIHLIL